MTVLGDLASDALIPAAGTAFASTTGTHAARLAAAHVAGRLWKETDTGLVYLDDGANWIIWNPEGQVLKTADETVNNSIALQNDDHLFCPIETNETWFLDVLLQVSGVSTNADLNVGWTGPTGTSALWAAYQFGAGGDANWNSQKATGTASASRDITQSWSFALLNGTNLARISGWFSADATHAGTINLQWAQNTLTAENVKVLKNSLLVPRRLS